MKKTYTYRITNKENNCHYYGVRSADNPYEDLGHKYFSSSKDLDFMNEQKINPNKFKYKILKVFDSFEEAITGPSKFSETNLHIKFNVQSNDKFYNKQNSSKEFGIFCAPGYMTAYDTKYNKYTRIKKEKLDRKRYILNSGFNSGNLITIRTDSGIEMIHKDNFDPKIHKHYRAETTVIEKDGIWSVIPLSEYKPNIHKTPRTGKISALKKGDTKYKMIDVELYLNNKDIYTIPTIGNVQLRNGDKIINVPFSDKEKYIKLGYKHMNKGRSNCLNLLNGIRYKEYSDILISTPWLCSGKSNIQLFDYKGKIFNTKNLNKYLLKYENISLYKFKKIGEYNIYSINEVISKKYKEEDFYNENKHKRLI